MLFFSKSFQGDIMGNLLSDFNYVSWGKLNVLVIYIPNTNVSEVIIKHCQYDFR